MLKWKHTSFSVAAQYLVVIILLNSGHPTFAHIDKDDRELLSIIAQFNRANQQILNSFDCQHDSTLQFFEGFPLPDRKDLSPDRIKEITRKGRYAFSGNKSYSLVTNNLGDSLHYVSNEKQQRLSNVNRPRFIMLSSQGKLTPPLPNPWNQLSAGTAKMIDKLDPKHHKVISVERTQVDGREHIIVAIEQRFASSPENQFDHTLTFHFSVEDGFLPVRIQEKGIPKPGKELFTIDAVVKRVLKHPVQGSTLYLPAEIHEERYRGERLISTSDLKIHEESVRINPELPDELFRIDIEPGDTVVDKDLGVELANPYNLDLIRADIKADFSNDRDPPSEAIDDTPEDTVKTATNPVPNEPETIKVSKISQTPPSEPVAVLEPKTPANWLWLGIGILGIGLLLVMFGRQFLVYRHNRSD